MKLIKGLSNLFNIFGFKVSKPKSDKEAYKENCSKIKSDWDIVEKDIREVVGKEEK